MHIKSCAAYERLRIVKLVKSKINGNKILLKLNNLLVFFNLFLFSSPKLRINCQKPAQNISSRTEIRTLSERKSLVEGMKDSDPLINHGSESSRRKALAYPTNPRKLCRDRTTKVRSVSEVFLNFSLELSGAYLEKTRRIL